MALDLDDFRRHADAVIEYYEELVAEIRRPKRYIRDFPDPFLFYEEKDFQRRYRFSKNVVREVLYPFVQHLEKLDQRGLPISAMRKLLLALRFYATGSFQEVCGDMSGISQTTAGASVKSITEALASQLRDHVKLPESDADVNATMEYFNQFGNFPGVVAVIDCTHIPIANPGEDRGEIFRNRHGIFSLNVQVAVGNNMKIIDIYATRPGSFHDSRIFEGSGLKTFFEQARMQGVMLGDSGYPCLCYLFMPILHPQSEAEERYNAAHIRTRNVVERTFGVWKRRFRCLTKKLEYRPENVVAIICAVAVLHNISRDVQAAVPGDELPWANEHEEIQGPIAADNRVGHYVRAEFIRQHFT